MDELKRRGPPAGEGPEGWASRHEDAMNIFNLLHRYGLDTRLDIVDGSRVRVTLTERAVEGAEPKVTDILIRTRTTHSRLSGFESSVVTAARRLLGREHPALRAWFEQMGEVPVKLEDTARSRESLGEAIHRAIRTMCDSDLSVIQWHAITALHPQDWTRFLDDSVQSIARVEAQAREEGQPLFQRDVGLTLHRYWSTAPFNRLQDIDRNWVEGERRTEGERLALLALAKACAATDVAEFIWGWTAYLCRPEGGAPAGEPEAQSVDSPEVV